MPEGAAAGRPEDPPEVQQGQYLITQYFMHQWIELANETNEAIIRGLSLLLDHEDGLDEGVHLVHVSAGPHDPHADGPDQHRHAAHPTSCLRYVWLADLWLGGLLIPT